MGQASSRKGGLVVVGVTVAVIGIIAIASMTDYKEGKKKKKKEKEKSKTAKKLKPVSHSARVQCHCLVEQCMEAQSRKQVVSWEELDSKLIDLAPATWCQTMLKKRMDKRVISLGQHGIWFLFTRAATDAQLATIATPSFEEAVMRADFFNLFFIRSSFLDQLLEPSSLARASLAMEQVRKWGPTAWACIVVNADQTFLACSQSDTSPVLFSASLDIGAVYHHSAEDKDIPFGLGLSDMPNPMREANPHFTRAVLHEAKRGEDKCPICFEPLLKGQHVAECPNHHPICLACSVKLSRSCPLCNAKL